MILPSKQCSILNEYQLTTSSNSFCKYRLPYLMNYYIATAIPSPSSDANTFHRKQCKNWVNKSIVLLFVCYFMHGFNNMQYLPYTNMACILQ